MTKTHRWILRFSLWLVLISQKYATVDGAAVMKRNCSENEYWNKMGFCCDKCHPGFSLKQECSGEGQRSVCEQCKNGTYLSNPNYHPTCFSCRDCRKPNMEQISDCTIKKDRECKCIDGYYMRQLDYSASECVACKKCGTGQLEVRKCTSAGYDHCICKENHYRVENKTNLCEPCVECNDGCKHLCSTPVTTRVKTTSKVNVYETVVPICACIMAVAVGVFLLYEGIRIWKKKKRASSNQSPSRDDKAKHENEPMVEELLSSEINNVSITNQSCETEPCRELPDCVPREIKIHEFFYFALDEIPVARFKELARRLGVSEQDIERAERDHRACKDAHYQMLKVWSDRGIGGGSNILSCQLVQMFVETLRDMYLTSCADCIENKFILHDRNISR